MSEKLPSVWLNELTWKDVEKYLEKDDTILIPIGSTEQHGPAGPLGVDTYAAIALAEDTAKEGEVLTTPPLWFGDSAHHLGFPGSLSLRTETLTAVIKDIVRSLGKHGFKKIVVINGHKGSNLAGVSTALKNLHQEEMQDVLMALADPMYIAKGIAHKIKDTIEHHAGELEISHVWYKFPHLIREDNFTDENVDIKKILSPFATDDLMGSSGDHVEIFWNSKEQRKFAPTGSFSASKAASKDKGQKYHEYMVARLVELVDWMRNNDSPIAKS